MTTNKQMSETDPEQVFLATIRKEHSRIVEVTIPVRFGHLALLLHMCEALDHIDPKPVLQRMLESEIEMIPDSFSLTSIGESIKGVYLTDPEDATKSEPLELGHVDLDDC